MTTDDGFRDSKVGADDFLRDSFDGDQPGYFGELFWCEALSRRSPEYGYIVGVGASFPVFIAYDSLTEW